MTTEQEIRRVLKKVAREWLDFKTSRDTHERFDTWIVNEMPIEEEKEDLKGRIQNIIYKYTAQPTSNDYIRATEEILKLINK